MQLTGYHIYYKFKESDKYEPINHLILLCSILKWKKHFGKINLLCNSEFLIEIKKYNIDILYDNINTDILDNINFKDKINTFWSYPKIYGIYNINKLINEPFCVIDTDLWIDNPQPFYLDYDINFYHGELFSLTNKNNPYPDPKNWFNKENFNLETLPHNCAIIFFNKNYKDIINIWFNYVSEIIENNIVYNCENKQVNAIFIEQRLLPILLNKYNITYQDILPNKYLTFNNGLLLNGNEWFPPLRFNDENTKLIESIRHIWGAKKLYNDEFVRNIVLELTQENLKEFNLEKFKYLIEKINET